MDEKIPFVLPRIIVKVGDEEVKIGEYTTTFYDGVCVSFTGKECPKGWRWATEGESAPFRGRINGGN